MPNRTDNQGMGSDESNNGFATVADLAVILDERPSVIVAAIAQLGIESAVALWPDETFQADGIFDADSITKLERHFAAAQREPA